MQRKTYAVIDGKKLEQNVKKIIGKYSDYEYYFGVVKNNAYHHGMKCVLDMIRGGINYFAVSSLEEALQVRKYTDLPLLCLEPISLEFIDDIINANITITVESLEYLKELLKIDLFATVKIHLAVDSGMNRIGFQTKEEFSAALEIIRQSKFLYLEGVYSHFATSGIMDPYWDRQVNRFLKITSDVSLKDVPIVHFGRSLTLVNHPKLDFCNGIRLGIIMFGFSQSQKKDSSLRGKLRIMKREFYQKKYHCSPTFLENDLHLETVMSLYSEVMSCRKVVKGDVVGYNTYKVIEDGYVLTVPIGYADGVTKSFQFVAIQNKFLPIISDSMDMIMVFAKEPFKVGEVVEIFGNSIEVSSLCRRVGLNSYHLFNQISHRVLRIHKNDREKEEIFY